MRCGSSSSSTCSCRRDKVAVMELLDEYWFFQNLFNRTRNLRSSLDPRCSENNLVKSPDDTFSSTAKSPKADVIISRKMLRTTTLLPRVGKEKADRKEESRHRMNTLQHSIHSGDLLASPPRIQLHSLKCVAPNSGTPRHRLPPKDSKVEGANKDDTKMKEANSTRARAKANYKRWKSQSDLEFEEVRGFMDLGFIFNKEELDPRLVNMIPGLQNNRHREEDKVRRPYLSEAWISHSSAPLLLNWVDRNSVVGMKEQIKFWARAVASNVRQEC